MAKPSPCVRMARPSPFVRMAFVVGAGHMTNVAAVVVPSDEVLEALNASGICCESLVDACTNEEFCSRARSLVLSSVHQCCKDAALKAWETPQALSH